VVADIPEPRRTEQCVDQGVRNRVSVGVTLQTRVLGNPDAAKDEWPPGLEAV
jgi:hypothetical protein